MRIDGRDHRTIWLEDDGSSVGVIDQTRLPHRFETLVLRTSDDAARAIRDMVVRGAPLIGATAAWGVALACVHDPSDAGLLSASRRAAGARPARPPPSPRKTWPSAKPSAGMAWP